MIHTFIRAYRKRSGLSQQHLADLIQVSRAVIDRTEAGQARPTLDLAFRLQVVFGVDPSTLFPETFGRIEERIMRSAKAQYDGLDGKSNERAVRLRSFYDAMAQRNLIQGAKPPAA
jgi:transcriptional regulator with XRE-family HTH domain